MAKKQDTSTEHNWRANIPRFDQDEAYVRETKKLEDIRKQHAELTQQIAALNEKIANGGTVSEVDARAKAILDGGDVATDTVKSDKKQLQELMRQEQAFDVAISTQEDRVRDAAGKANLRFQDQFKAVYEPLLQRTAAALVEFSRAVQAELELKATLEGVGMCLYPNIDAPTRSVFGPRMGTHFQGSPAKWLKAVNEKYPNIEVPDDFSPNIKPRGARDRDFK